MDNTSPLTVAFATRCTYVESLRPPQLSFAPRIMQFSSIPKTVRSLVRRSEFFANRPASKASVSFL
jgi:hypothetical protein